MRSGVSASHRSHLHIALSVHGRNPISALLRVMGCFGLIDKLKLNIKPEYIRHSIRAKRFHSHSIHCLCMDSIMPDETPKRFPQRPCLIITSEIDHVFQEVRPAFQNCKATFSAFRNISLMICGNPDFTEVIIVDIFRVFVHFKCCTRNLSIKGDPGRKIAFIFIRICSYEIYYLKYKVYNYLLYALYIPYLNGNSLRSCQEFS